MAQKKFTELTTASAATGAEILAVVQDGVSKKITLDAISADGGDWTFADNGGNFPTAPRKGLLYVAQDDHGNPGDSDYVPEGTWMWSKVAGANSFANYSYK